MIRVERNAEKDGIEIFFDAKPNEPMRDRIKSLGFRYGRYKKCWYAVYTPERWEYAVLLTGAAASASAISVENKNQGIITASAETTATPEDNAISDKVESAIAYLQQLLEEI